MKRGQTKMELNGHQIELMDIGEGWTVWIDGAVCREGIVRPQTFATKRAAHGHALRLARAA